MHSVSLEIASDFAITLQYKHNFSGLVRVNCLTIHHSCVLDSCILWIDLYLELGSCIIMFMICISVHNILSANRSFSDSQEFVYIHAPCVDCFWRDALIFARFWLWQYYVVVVSGAPPCAFPTPIILKL